MGTMLQQGGPAAGAMPESWNVERPEVLRSIHCAYLDAGCDVITANTFGANALKCEGTPYTAPQLIRQGVCLAREAAEESGRPARVAVDIGPTGKLLAPLGDLPFETAYALFAEMAKAGEEAGGGSSSVETMNDPYELKAAGSRGERKHLSAGHRHHDLRLQRPPADGRGYPRRVALLEGLRVDALGVNCGMGPEPDEGPFNGSARVQFPSDRHESECRPASLCGWLYRV